MAGSRRQAAAAAAAAAAGPEAPAPAHSNRAHCDIYTTVHRLTHGMAGCARVRRRSNPHLLVLFLELLRDLGHRWIQD